MARKTAAEITGEIQAEQCRLAGHEACGWVHEGGN